jgi:hypothetical protein
VLKHNLNCYWPTFGVGITGQNLATFHESKIFIKFCLQSRLMLYAVGPIEMITYCENHVSGFGISADDVHDIKLLDRQFVVPFLALLFRPHNLDFRGGNLRAARITRFSLSNHSCS